MDGMKQSSGKRYVHLDILRVLAICGVLFIHSGDYGIYRYVTSESRFVFWLGSFFVAVIQYCVPLFFIISGALLLKKQESLSYVLKHRALRIVIVIAILVLIQYVRLKIAYPESYNLFIYIQMLYEGALQTEYWFLFEYLGFLLVLPFLQRMVGAVEKASWFVYLFLLYLVINCISPFVTLHMEWGNMKYRLPMFSVYIICALMGYFVEHRSGDFFLKGKNVLAFVPVVALMVADTMYVNYRQISTSVAGCCSHYFVAFYAGFLYVAVRYICHKCNMPEALRKFFAFLGGGVFGTYLLENWLRPLFLPVYEVLYEKIGSYPATFIWLFACLVVGILVSNLLKKVPGIGKLL